jgi:hypothetical protein
MNAIVIDEATVGKENFAWDICIRMAELGETRH